MRCLRSPFRLGPALALLAILSLLASIGPAAAAPAASPPRQEQEPQVERAEQFDASDLATLRARDGHPRLDSQLAAIARLEREQGAEAALAAARGRGLAVVGDRVRVVVETGQPDRAPARAGVATAGGQVEAEYEDLVQALVPVPALDALAGHPGVRFVRPPFRMVLDAVGGQGVGTTGAAVWQGRGLTGAGVKIGIIDGGFAGLSAAQSNGDLPPTLFAHDFCSGAFNTATTHGTAVAEIVHEMAPQAELHLFCVGTEVQLGQAKDTAKSQGIQIVNHSAGWFNTSRGDGSGGPGTPDAIVADAVANGILWVNSAGNHAQQHWSGNFSDTNDNDFHEFAPGDEGNTIFLHQNASVCAYLKWDSWPVTNQDFDLILAYLSGNTAIPVAVSANDQFGFTLPPTEWLCYQNNTGTSQQFFFVIWKFEASTSPRFDLFIYGGPVLEYQVAQGSVIEPASSPRALAVGAICWGNGALEPYSSQGPTIDGRIKPDLAGPDSVSTYTYGGFTACGTTGFTGTSASAPHAAGAAALVKQQNPFYGAAQLRSFLEGRGLDLGPFGRDNQFGAGAVWLRIFNDVPPGDWGYSWIERVYQSGVTSGCFFDSVSTTRLYCPDGSVTRAQMAIFLLKAKLGAGYSPPPASGNVFADVPAGYWAAAWIEELARQGITGGCSVSPPLYCPEASVTRAQMAVFLLKAKQGASYLPPAAGGIFADVPTSYWAASWIEELYRRGITGGCATSPLRYCPESANSRREMAVFLVKTFSLP